MLRGEDVMKHHRWRDADGIVHLLTDVADLGAVRTRTRGLYRCLSGEVRTVCWIRLGDNHFMSTRAAPTCVWCVTDRGFEWRGRP